MRAHERARRGEAVDLAPRPVRVHALEVLACSEAPPFLTVRVEVDKGYYVRSLARDLAAGLGTVGHLTSLRRTRSGCFTLAEALPLDTPADELAARVEHVLLAPRPARSPSPASPTRVRWTPSTDAASAQRTSTHPAQGRARGSTGVACSWRSERSSTVSGA